MVKQIIKEAMDQNPLGLKEAVAEELRTRVALALEAKMNDLEEAFKVGTKVKVDSPKDEDHGKAGKIVTAKNGTYVVQFVDGKRGSFNEDELVNESVDLEEAKMTDAEVLSAAKALAANGKDAKTKAFGKGLVDFYKKEGSFTPAQVGGLQNIMKNAPFQMAKESVELDEAVVGAGPAFFDDGSHTTISPEDAAAINRMFASKSSEEQATARKKMKASKSYYSSVLAKARKG